MSRDNYVDDETLFSGTAKPLPNWMKWIKKDPIIQDDETCSYPTPVTFSTKDGEDRHALHLPHNRGLSPLQCGLYYELFSKCHTWKEHFVDRYRYGHTRDCLLFLKDFSYCVQMKINLGLDKSASFLTQEEQEWRQHRIQIALRERQRLRQGMALLHQHSKTHGWHFVKRMVGVENTVEDQWTSEEEESHAADLVKAPWHWRTSAPENFPPTMSVNEALRAKRQYQPYFM